MPSNNGTATLAVDSEETPARSSQSSGPDGYNLSEMVNDGNGDSGEIESGGLLQNRDLRQFVKFCIVGASSTAITFIVLNVCYHFLHLPLFTSLTAAFLLSVMNGFYWNRRWTFKKARGNSAKEQSVKFLGVNLVGYLLNTSIVVLVVAHYAAGGHSLFGTGEQLKTVLYNILSGEKQQYSRLLVNGAQAVAVCIVVFWNFFANRHWTFKH